MCAMTKPPIDLARQAREVLDVLRRAPNPLALAAWCREVLCHTGTFEDHVRELRHYAVVQLRDGGLTTSEVADVTGLSKSHIKTIYRDAERIRKGVQE